MKTTNRLFTAIMATLLLLNTTAILAQDEASQGPEYVTMTTMHWNMEMKDFKMDEWKAIEKEFLDKVTKNNEHIMAAGFYLHNMTPDNSELIYVQAFKNWNAIDLASKRNNELSKEAWPEEADRKAFFKKQNAYYSPMHSDEIYATIPSAKSLAEVKEGMIVYLRTSHFAFPEDGSNEEFMETFKEYTENVTHKNEYIKAYYPMNHAYGSDKTQFVEAYFLDSLADMEKMFDKDDELFNEHWKDEEAKKEMNEIGDKYFTGLHGDAVYSVVPELRK
ncbi:hypothetical protein MBM09_03740 [Flaviramulus sp. BrNp1-15]|uniref:hypothetical protein n=1 Tax=Flaviramulus sp. BrNp1-15 TaxID=2916754 RepID=UPI001EE9778E|nr:hypothetical protein [Flaviramulus sp. BrNp1-15]ULC60103.1 hypothetical protein MBM09_03740 [Flaviramulus sp. BrNp1-15]